MTPRHVKAALDVLCGYYADREGQPRRLTAVQAVVYAEGLARFNEQQLQAASRAWMRRSKFFPALSDLLELLEPPVDWQVAAHLAWSAVEKAIRQGGAYRGAEFANGAIGQAVLETFGSWATACSFDRDSPGWAIRRQTFLAIFPALAARHDGAPVVCRGLFPHELPHWVPPLDNLPLALSSGEPDPRKALTHGEASKALADIKQRAIDAGKVEP